MSDLDLLLTWKAWEAHSFLHRDSRNSAIFVPAGEFIDAFLDSWHSAYGAEAALLAREHYENRMRLMSLE